MEWIDCTDKLPKAWRGGPIEYVIFLEGLSARCGFLDAGTKKPIWKSVDMTSVNQEKVTHWFLLPPFPDKLFIV